MKTIRKISGIVLMVVVMLSTAACSSDDKEDVAPSNQLVGTWVESDVSYAPFTLILNKDNTGSLSYDTNSRALLTDHFSWSTSQSDGYTYLNIVHTSGDLIVNSVVNQYVLAGNSLVILFNIQGERYQANFVRK